MHCVARNQAEPALHYVLAHHPVIPDGLHVVKVLEGLPRGVLVALPLDAIHVLPALRTRSMIHSVHVCAGH
jgi:hypothetical protein